MPGRRTQDCYRHGITGLFAACTIAGGTVITFHLCWEPEAGVP